MINQSTAHKIDMLQILCPKWILTRIDSV